MKLEIGKLEDRDVSFSTEPISEEQHQAFSAFLQKRKAQRAKRAAAAAMKKAASITAQKPG